MCIVDAYNPYIYPGDEKAAKGIKYTIHVKPKDNDYSYLQKLRNAIEPAIE